MYKLLILIAFLTACGHVPHVDPLPRTQAQRLATVVEVDATCSEPNPFKTGEPDDPHALDPDIQWIPDRAASGVVISEQAVLTAGHATWCPTFPGVLVFLSDGERFPMYESRNAFMFEDGTDLAKLETVGDYDRFGVNVAPPKIGTAHLGDVLCYQPVHHMPVCGAFEPYDGHMIFRVESHPGDSGAPVYDGDVLVGLVIKGVRGDNYTEYVPINASWLKGT